MGIAPSPALTPAQQTYQFNAYAASNTVSMADQLVSGVHEQNWNAIFGAFSTLNDIHDRLASIPEGAPAGIRQAYAALGELGKRSQPYVDALYKLGTVQGQNDVGMEDEGDDAGSSGPVAQQPYDAQALARINDGGIQTLATDYRTAMTSFAAQNTAMLPPAEANPEV